jgi:DNA-directed RNA polymerase specialized sigma24 family protein
MESVPLHRLDAEWRRQLAGPQLAGRLAAWRRQAPALASFADAASLMRLFRGDAQPATKDRALHALIEIARTDSLAGLVVLEAIMPGLKRVSRRVLHDPADRDELWATLLAAAWETIRRYPLHRRQRVAANLLLDTMRGTLAALSEGRRGRGELTDDVTALVAAEPVDGDVDGLLDLAVEAGAVSAQDAELILRTRIDGFQLVDLAAEQGVAYNTLKVRRQRAERRLLVFLGHRPVPRRPQNRRSFPARVAGAGVAPAGEDAQST